MRKEILKYLKEFKLGTEKMFKEFFDKETNKSQRANMWTFTRLIIPFLTVACSTIAIITSTFPLLICSSILAGAGAITDYLDGKSAKKHNSTSEYGKLLDQVSDKVFAGIIGINLLFLNPNYLLILLGEAIISIINVYYRFSYKNLEMKSTMMGRIKEWPLFITLALGYLSNLNPILNIISNVSIIITFPVQLLAAKSYITECEKGVKLLEETRNVTTTSSETPEDKAVTKTLELDPHTNTNSLSDTQNEKKPSRIEQYQNLLEVLRLIGASQNQDQKEEDATIGVQKIKE